MSSSSDDKAKLHQVLKLAVDKEISYTPTQVKKMSPEQLEQVLQDHRSKELDELNDMISDVVIVKFEDLLKSRSWIKEDSHLAMKLQDKKLFKRDLKNIVSYFTPILPWIGLLEGSVVVATEVMEGYASRLGDKNKSDDEQDDSPEAQERGEQDST